MQKQKLPEAPSVDYEAFARKDWTPEFVRFCLAHWPTLEEAALWGIESGDWPPSIAAETISRAYFANINILTTRADLHLALRKLPPKQAVAVYAYHRFKWTQAEVGRHMGYSKRHAGRLLHEGERRLQKILGGMSQ